MDKEASTLAAKVTPTLDELLNKYFDYYINHNIMFVSFGVEHQKKFVLSVPYFLGSI